MLKWLFQALPPPPLTNIPKSVTQEVPVPSIQQQQVQNANPAVRVLVFGC